MKYAFSFRSRNCALRFYDALVREGVTARIINAPRVGGSCALGVEVNADDLDRARRVVSSGYPSFIAIYPAGV